MTLAQQYKLTEYKSCIGIYQDLLKDGASEDELADIMTNLLACAANQPDAIVPISRLQEGFSFQKTYEYFFNLSQVLMKEERYQEALSALLKSFGMAREDGADHTDLSRFKVQEIHTLNSFQQEFNQVEYGANARFALPKTLRHENLVEINLSAFQETYEIDKRQFKELIGSLNWSKFSERIQQQLLTNQNLTAEQRRLMQVNLVVAQIRAHRFEEAQKQWEKMSAQNDHPALKGIGAFFALK